MMQSRLMFFAAVVGVAVFSGVGAQQPSKPSPSTPAATASPATPPAGQIPAATDRVTVVPKAPYSSDHAQLAQAKMDGAQKDVANIQLQAKPMLEAAQNTYAAWQQKLNDWKVSVRKANGWDDTYDYDAQKDEWFHNVPKPSEAKK